MRKLTVMLAVILMGFGFIANSYCATPGTIKYQGVLKYKGELINGAKSMEFKIYDTMDVGTGNLCWDSAPMTVIFEQGVFVSSLTPCLPPAGGGRTGRIFSR